MSVDIAEWKFHYIGYLFRIASLVKGKKIKWFNSTRWGIQQNIRVSFFKQQNITLMTQTINHYTNVDSSCPNPKKWPAFNKVGEEKRQATTNGTVRELRTQSTRHLHWQGHASGLAIPPKLPFLVMESKGELNGIERRVKAPQQWSYSINCKGTLDD